MILYQQETIETSPSKSGNYNTDEGWLYYNETLDRWTRNSQTTISYVPYYWYKEIEIPDNIVSTFAYLQE